MSKRNKTIFPLNSREVFKWRVITAWMLRKEGVSFRGIRQVMKLSGPDQARRLVARGNLLFPEFD